MSSALWQTVLGEIELSVSRATFVTWFKNTELIEEADGHVVIGVPNIFAKQQLEVKFNTQITEILQKNGLMVSSITYRIKSLNKKKAPAKREMTAPLATSAPTASHRASGPSASSATTGLNPKYTFDTFIVGSSNELAYAACQAVAANPGTKYNPLFLYGGVGLGKTHLIQAVGTGIAQNDPDARIAYISSETFVNEFLEAIRFKKKGFADRYRQVDVLIIDDMQFIAGKEKTQEEFFHTFNALHQANKQIIISSDKPPKSIPTLEERLRSRFEWGMTIDIQMPDFETRSAILQSKAQSHGVTLDRETVEFLATNVQTNIRELEGALNQLLAYCEMRGLTPDVQIAQGLIGNNRQRPQHLTPKQVVEKTARHFQIPMGDMIGPKRDKHIVVPRQVAMYLLRSELHLSFPKIAGELGRKDHTTAIHSIDKVERTIALDISMRQIVAEIREKLYV
ncbi:MAG TPA: chromosomal replication initiator protein DnaA [Candidatus Saccharimonadales bacterium]|nr:chromosomal replication initiator protein DnaA [Candidatus Saccharimonadales bacterium]